MLEWCGLFCFVSHNLVVFSPFQLTLHPNSHEDSPLGHSTKHPTFNRGSQTLATYFALIFDRSLNPVHHVLFKCIKQVGSKGGRRLSFTWLPFVAAAAQSVMQNPQVFRLLGEGESMERSTPPTVSARCSASFSAGSNPDLKVKRSLDLKIPLHDSMMMATSVGQS